MGGKLRPRLQLGIKFSIFLTISCRVSLPLWETRRASSRTALPTPCATAIPTHSLPTKLSYAALGFISTSRQKSNWLASSLWKEPSRQEPDRADCWAMLSWLYRAEYSHDYNQRPDSMDRCLKAARRAVALAPSSQLANAALASAFFFRRELRSFRAPAERALALHSMEGYITAFLGMEFAYSGDWERGCALAERATQLNSNHPSWYWSAMVINAYRQRDSQRALELVLRVNMPGLWTAQLALVVIYTQVGDIDRARVSLRGLLEIRPKFGSVAREELLKWWQPDLVEQMLGDLRKAGLDTSSAPGQNISQPVSPTTATPLRTPSGES